MASPTSSQQLIEAPRRGDDSEDRTAQAYWTSLLHMRVYSLGWSRPDEGLRWWYDNGRPTDDPTRAARRDLGPRRTARLVRRVAVERAAAGTIHCRHRDDARTQQNTTQLENDRMRIEDRSRDAVKSGIPAPDQRGGRDMLHLSAHLQAPKEQNQVASCCVAPKRTGPRCCCWTRWWAGTGTSLCTEPRCPRWGTALGASTSSSSPWATWGPPPLTSQRLWFAGRHRWHTPGT